MLDPFVRDIKSDPGCGSGTLVYLAIWEHKSLTYWAFIRAEKECFCFEGKYRKGNGRHTYFPREDYNFNNLGSKENCLYEVERILRRYNCNIEERNITLEKINQWNFN